MKWRYQILLVSVNIIFLLLLSGCNCGNGAEGNDESGNQYERVNHGYAGKDESGNKYIKKCDKNYADCNKDVNDGCESLLTSDINNCGSCGKVCLVPENTSAVACENSVCAIDYCISGYTDLDKKYDNGCEYRCTPISDKEIANNMQDDDCDGFIDNVCKYAVDSKTYVIASDLSGKISDIVSVSNDKYSIVGFVESRADMVDILRVAVIDSNMIFKFITQIKEVGNGGRINSISLLIKDNSIIVFWSENYKDGAKIYLSSLNFNGIIEVGETLIYEGFNTISNIITGEYNGEIFLSFETTENNVKSIIAIELNKQSNEMVSKRLISTANIDCYGHNIFFVDNILYASYWEMRDGYLELVVMANKLFDNKKERFSIHKTELNASGSALSYGKGYFVLIWTESTGELGTMYLALLDSNFQSIILKKVELNYEEAGLPVINYNGNIFGNTFVAVRNNNGYVLFSDIDISGKKLSELIISPVSILEKPYMSSRGNEFYVFYTDINSNMKYFLNMKRVYCIEN